MIPNSKDRALETQGASISGAFGISLKDSVHLEGILRDTLYTDRHLAVLREYSTNAWDAHRQVGKGDVPIKVTLPTLEDLTLSIRDFGPGLSPEDIFQVYTQYGASTKRSSDNVVGMLGIGSKSGFAYSDNFSITSWNGGLKCIYSAALNKDGKGILSQLHQEPCGTETGILIQIPVKPNDIFDFQARAKSFFRFFEPRPEINGDIAQLPESSEKFPAGYLQIHGNSWFALMGCIAYKVDLSQVSDQIQPYLHNMGGTLVFNIGEIEISANREELRYSDHTKKMLVDGCNALSDQFISSLLKRLDTEAKNSWEKRLLARSIIPHNIPAILVAKDLSDSSVEFPHLKWKSTENYRKGLGNKDPAEVPPKEYAFSMVEPSARGSRKSINRLPICVCIDVTPSTSLIIRDEFKKALNGYSWQRDQYLILPTDKTPKGVEKAKKDLTEALVEIGCDGITVSNLSSRQWATPAVDVNARIPDIRHHRTVFTYNNNSRRSGSRNWDVEEDHVPSKKDVFVVLKFFETKMDDGYKSYDFYPMYNSDRAMAATLWGGKMPTVIGYKDTEKKPILIGDCKGREYRQWRGDFHKKLLTPKVLWLLEMNAWFGQLSNYGRVSLKEITNIRLRLRYALGPKHEILRVFNKWAKAALAVRRHSGRLQSASDLRRLLPAASTQQIKEVETAAKSEFDALYQKYPLLLMSSNKLASLWKTDIGSLILMKDRRKSAQAVWFQYIKLIDKETKT